MKKRVKKKTKFFVLGVIIVILFGVSSCSEEGKPKLYWCGLSQFGGAIEVGDPSSCEEQREKLQKYMPLCEELVEKYEPSWEVVCKRLLNPPEIKMGTCGELYLSSEDSKYCTTQLDLLQEETKDLAEEEKLAVYKPLCEEVASKIVPSWEDACGLVLRTPEAVCIANMDALGIALSKDERNKCYDRLSIIAEEIWGGEYD